MQMIRNRDLTSREQEVLALIGQGKTSKQIAETLGLSVYTVNNHRKHICQKLRLHSTAELVVYAVKNSADTKTRLAS